MPNFSFLSGFNILVRGGWGGWGGFTVIIMQVSVQIGLNWNCHWTELELSLAILPKYHPYITKYQQNIAQKPTKILQRYYPIINQLSHIYQPIVKQIYPNITLIFPKYFLNITKMSPRYCPNIANYCQDINQISKNVTKISQRNYLNNFKISPRYYQNITQILLINMEQIYHNIVQTSLKCHQTIIQI